MEYRNCRGDYYYLHQGLTKTGKTRYYFSRKAEGDLAPSIPRGWEIYENPNGQVFLRKKTPRLISGQELKAVKDGIARFSDLKYWKVETKKNAIVVYLPDQDPAETADFLTGLGCIDPRAIEIKMIRSASYSPVLRFVLVDGQDRLFNADRWCWRGSIDDWIGLAYAQKLPALVKKYCPHLGKESFYELY